MAHIKRKFTFDDPEDSYWNESGSNSSSLFDDLPSKQWAARAAVDNLFEQREVFSAKVTQPSTSLQNANANDDSGEISQKREDAVQDFINHKAANLKLEQQSIWKHRSEKSRVQRCRPYWSLDLLHHFAIRQNSELTNSEVDHVDIRLAIGQCNDCTISEVDQVDQGQIESSPLHAGGPSAASVVSECSVSSLPSDAHRLDLDYSRLRAEHRKLQRHLEAVRHDRYRAPEVKEAVRRLLKGNPVSLEWYRSKEEKVQLLDAAIDIVDGNVILAVVLFLKSTLIDSIFRDLLLRKPQAAEEYISFLKMTRDYDELTTTLFALGRNADAAMIEFSAAIRHQVADQKVQALKKCVRSGFSDPLLNSEASVVNDFIGLLEQQIPINVADDQSRNPAFTAFPKNASLVGRSVIATYYYCCLYHYDDPVHALANPSHIRDTFRITDKEAVWTSVSALAKQCRWPDVERVLQPKTLLGALQNRAALNSPKLSCPFSWQNLFHILHSNSNAPPKDLSCRILRAVNDADMRLKLAEKYDVCEIVIECLVAQKDRLRLAKFASKLTPHTPDAYKALAALNNTGTKWKN